MGSLAAGGGYGKETGFEPRELRSQFSPKRNDSGVGESNFSPPMMKCEAKYGRPFFGGYLKGRGLRVVARYLVWSCHNIRLGMKEASDLI